MKEQGKKSKVNPLTTKDQRQTFLERSDEWCKRSPLTAKEVPAMYNPDPDPDADPDADPDETFNYYWDWGQQIKQMNTT